MIAKHIFKNPKFPEFRTGCKDRRQVIRLIRYIQKESGNGVCLMNDLGSEDALQMADEIEAMHGGHKYLAYHMALVYPSSEIDLWRPKIVSILNDLKNYLGRGANVSVYVRDHFDKIKSTWHPHIVVVATDSMGRSVQLTQQRISDKGEYYQATTAQILREFAQKWEDLTPGCKLTGKDADGNPRGEPKPHYSKDELEMHERLHREKKRPTPCPDKMILTERVNFLVRSCTSIPELVQRCADNGISARVTDHVNNGVPAHGISFADEHISIRGAKAGWTYNQIAEFYEQNTNPNSGGSGSPTRIIARENQPEQGRIDRAVSAPVGAEIECTPRRVGEETQRRAAPASRPTVENAPVVAKSDPPSSGFTAFSNALGRLSRETYGLMQLIKYAFNQVRQWLDNQRPEIP